MPPTTSQPSTLIPIWLDCDPGHDDAFAILLSANHPNLHLLGISTVHGNTSLAGTTTNAGRVLSLLGCSDVPVYPGAAKPFCRKAVHAPNIHGASGLDGTDLLPKAQSPPITHTNAVLAMRDALLAQQPGTVWVVATGALTNVALLFATFPEVAAHIRGLSIMGGSIGGKFTEAPLGKVEGSGERIGNITQWAEFNIYCDPESAHSVLSSPILAPKTILIPLDVTHLVLATQSVQKTLLYGSSPSTSPSSPPSTIRQALNDLLLFFAHTYASVFGITAGPPLHDPIAVAVVLFEHGIEELKFEYGKGGEEESWEVSVVTEGVHGGDDEIRRAEVGRTVLKKVKEGAGGGVRIPRGLEVERFWTVLEDCVERAEMKAKGKREGE
ncbi:Uridine nucleosidase 1 [Varicellaria rhodocarpa]|nr:Uridine nucleosidase 1 [Varicellaria rhodocarpa]